MKSTCLTGGPMHVSYTKRVPEGRRDRNSTMLTSPDHTGHVALLLAMSAPQDPNWACCNSATPPPARPKFCIDLAWGVTNNWQKNWPGRRGVAKAPRVHPHSCHKVTVNDNKLLPNRSHLGNASPKGGLAFFWGSFIIIFLKLAECL